MLDKQEILNELPNFYGTECYYAVHDKFVLTDGAKYIAESCDAFWLMDVIWSYITKYEDIFAVAKLIKRESDWLFTIDDGNDNIWAEQIIEYSDFPLDGIKLYVVKSEIGWVVMLTGEY